MNEELSLIIDESIQLELNVAQLYRIFHATFPEDASFWWRLFLEEENHAALIRSIKETFMPVGKFPDEIFCNSLENLKKNNTELRSLIRKFQDIAPSREDAFNIALKIEQSAGEIHFRNSLIKRKSQVSRKSLNV